MDEVVGQSRLLAPAGESVRLPVGHMVCNQTPPVGDKPSLMTFRVGALSLQTQTGVSRILSAPCVRDWGSANGQLRSDMSIRPAHRLCRSAAMTV